MRKPIRILTVKMSPCLCFILVKNFAASFPISSACPSQGTRPLSRGGSPLRLQEPKQHQVHQQVPLTRQPHTHNQNKRSSSTLLQARESPRAPVGKEKERENQESREQQCSQHHCGQESHSQMSSRACLI